jgi:hypothetical protein
VIFRHKQPAGPPVPVGQRYQQALADGGVRLHPFSQLELSAVTLEPDGVPPGQQRQYLQPLSPVLARFLAQVGGRADTGQPGPDGSGDARLITELGGAAAGLEQRGFMHDGPPAPPAGRMQVEFAGLAASPDGLVRRVALAGDLGIVTRMRGQVLFVAEVLGAADPVAPDLVAEHWGLIGRVYTPYGLPGCLAEQPPAPDGVLPPLTLMQERTAALALMEWLGADVPAFIAGLRRRAEGNGDPDEPRPASVWPEEQPGEVATADVAPGFSGLRELRLLQPQGEQVLVRGLMVGSGPAGYWLLEGEQLERATPVSVLQLGDRVDAMLLAASAGPDGQPDGQAAGKGQPG